MNHQYRLKLQQEIINDISRLQEKISDLFELQELEIEAYRNLLDTIILQSATNKGFRKSRKSHRSRKGKSSGCRTVLHPHGDFEKQIISKGQKIVVQEFKNLVRSEAQFQEKIQSIVSESDRPSHSRKINEVSDIKEEEIERRNQFDVMEDMGLFDFVGEEEYSEDPIDNPDEYSDDFDKEDTEDFDEEEIERRNQLDVKYEMESLDDYSGDYSVEEYPNEYLGESIKIDNFDGEEIERRNQLDLKNEMESLDDYSDNE